jgi:hypothetical protein
VLTYLIGLQKAFESKIAERIRLLAESGDDYDMSEVIGLAKSAFDRSFQPDAIINCFRKTGTWPLQDDIMQKLELDGVFKYQDVRQEEDVKNEAYLLSLQETRVSQSEDAYREKYPEDFAPAVKPGKPLARRFSALDHSEETLKERVDEFDC